MTVRPTKEELKEIEMLVAMGETSGVHLGVVAKLMAEIHAMEAETGQREQAAYWGGVRTEREVQERTKWERERKAFEGGFKHGADWGAWYWGGEDELKRPHWFSREAQQDGDVIEAAWQDSKREEGE